MKKAKILVISFCYDASGSPVAVATWISVTKKEYAEGYHYELAEAALEGDYEGPFVHFDEVEAPSWLLDEWQGGSLQGFKKNRAWKPFPREFWDI